MNHEKIHYYQRQEKFLEYGYALSNHEQPHKNNEQKNNENDQILKTEGSAIPTTPTLSQTLLGV